jgi:carboxymethylenebutenolidase
VCGDASQAVSTGRLDRAVPAHALAGHRISWHGRRYRVLPERGVSSYDPYVFAIPSGTGGSGRAGVREFYADQFLPKIPPDFELTTLSQTFGNDRIVEEFVIRFTHTLDMDWMLPGVSATGRKAEFAFVGIIEFQAGKVASERLYWDQATVLSQLGIPHHPVVAAGIGSAAHLLKLR